MDYLSYVKKRTQVFEQFTTVTGTGVTQPLEKLMPFFPDSLFRIITHFVKKKDKTAKPEIRKSVLTEFTVRNILMINAGVLVISFNLQRIFAVPWYVLLFGGVALQLSMFYFLKSKQIKHRDTLEKKLPEILDIMSRVYRVHTDLKIAVQEVSVHSSDQFIKKAFQDIVSLSRFGYTVEEAMETVAKDIQSPDFDFVIASIRMNVPLGGDLTYLFDNTARILRQRKEAADEIGNLMFQSKISSTISALLVPIIALVSFTTNDTYKEVLLYNPSGRLVFIGCLIWWIIGVVIIRKNSRVRI